MVIFVWYGNGEVGGRQKILLKRRIGFKSVGGGRRQAFSSLFLSAVHYVQCVHIFQDRSLGAAWSVAFILLLSGFIFESITDIHQI